MAAGGEKKKGALNDCLCWAREGPAEGWIAKRKRVISWSGVFLPKKEKKENFHPIQTPVRHFVRGAFSGLKDVSCWEVGDGLSPSGRCGVTGGIIFFSGHLLLLALVWFMISPAPCMVVSFHWCMRFLHFLFFLFQKVKLNNERFEPWPLFRLLGWSQVWRAVNHDFQRPPQRNPVGCFFFFFFFGKIQFSPPRQLRVASFAHRWPWRELTTVTDSFDPNSVGSWRWTCVPGSRCQLAWINEPQDTTLMFSVTVQL